jgi:hypothetical protein
VSSHTYSTELTPDPILRRIVLLAGVVTTVLGIMIILTLPVQAAWRAVAAALWLAQNARGLHLIAQGNKRCQRIRIAHNGEVDIMIAGKFGTSARLVAGSIVMHGFAWLRFESEDGQRFAELLRGRSPQNKDWRRLQVIWRHLGAGS